MENQNEKKNVIKITVIIMVKNEQNKHECVN